MDNGTGVTLLPVRFGSVHLFMCSLCMGLCAAVYAVCLSFVHVCLDLFVVGLYVFCFYACVYM